MTNGCLKLTRDIYYLSRASLFEVCLQFYLKQVEVAKFTFCLNIHVISYYVVLYRVVLYYCTLYCIILYCSVLHSAVLCCIVLYNLVRVTVVAEPILGTLDEMPVYGKMNTYILGSNTYSLAQFNLCPDLDSGMKSKNPGETFMIMRRTHKQLILFM